MCKILMMSKSDLWETTRFMFIWHTQEILILSSTEIPYVLKQNLKLWLMTPQPQPCHSHQQHDTMLFPVAWTTHLQAEGADSVNNK